MRPTRKMISLNDSIVSNVDGMGNLYQKMRKSSISKAIVLFFALILMSYIGKAQTTVAFSTTGSNTWVCPAGVTSITVKCWGAGGGGGSNSLTAVKCGGGGGGAYASSTISVTPGTTYYINVGAGAAATNGGNSWLNASTTSPYASVNSAPTGTATGILAAGGKGVTVAGTTTGGAGGLATNSYGTAKWDGGTGGTGGATWSGSGGGGAGSSTVGSAGNGTTGVGGAGGTGNPNAGTGGVGKNANGAGGAGVTYGGGGGGAYRAASGTNAGGAGAQGYVTVTYTCPNQTLTYSQGFNATSIPSCWSQQNVSTPNMSFTYPSTGTGTPAPAQQEGTNQVMFNSFINNGSQTRLVSTPITTTGTSSVDVQFQWYFSSNGGAASYLTEGVQVQYSTDGSTWVNAGSLIRRYGAIDGWALQTVTLPAGAGNQSTIYVGFLFTSNAGYDSYLDAAVIKPTPTCFTPTSVTSSSVTATTATISWTAASPAPSNGYTYEIRTSGVAGSGATGLATSGSTAAGVVSANISGLTSSTTYYVYVRSDCGGSGYSDWTSSYSFTTLIAACTTPTAQPTSLTLSSITATGLSGSFTAASPAPSGYLVVRSTSSSLSSNPVDATTYSAGNTLGGGTVIQVGATSNFTESSLSANTRYYYYIFSYNNTSCSGGPKYYTTSPLQNDATTCPNVPTSPTTTFVTSTGFTVGWTAPANGATDYTVDISLTNFGASIASFPSMTASTSLAVTGLSSATTYYYRIRSNNSSCSSTYTTVGSVTTACASVTTFPYTQSFGASIPACWSVSEGVAGASIHWAPTTADAIHGASASQSGSHFMFLDVYNAVSTKNPYYLTTGNFALNDTIKKLKYYYFLGASGYTTTPIPMEVEISTNGGTSWLSLYQHTSANSTMSAWSLNTIDLSAYINQTITLRFTSNSNYGSGICNQGIDEFVIENSTPMTYISCTTTQNNLDAVAPFTSNADVIGIQVVTTGTLNPLNASYFSFLTTGSTNPATDISNANIYYTGNSSTFAATNKFGSTKMLPNGRFSFTGTQTLTEGVNYFWLAYDIPLTASLGNIIDAQCDTITITSVRTPSTSSPAGNRIIGNVINMNNNPETVCYANFYDNGGASGNYTDNINYSKTFVPEAGKVMKVVFSSFNTAEIYDSLTVYDGPSNTSPVIGKYYGSSSPGTIIASNTGEITFSFKSDGMTNSGGWSAIVTCEDLIPNCATLNSPADGAINQATNTSISWTTGASDATHQPATSYKLYFGTDAAATNIQNGTNIGNVTSWGMILNINTTYYWKIVPVNASGDALGCSTIRSFTTAATQTLTTYTVPGDFATIKSAYNACTGALPYIINVTTGYAGETYPIALNADIASVVSNRSAANPIIIRPSATFSYTFLGAAAKVFEFSGGAKYITIDGRQGGTGTANSFIFKNTSTSTPVISFTGDNSYNNLQYCKIQGNNISTGIIDLTNPSGSGIRYITIDNNEITKNTGTPSDGILTEGTGALKNTKITITNNKVYDIYADVAYPTHGIYFGSNGFNYDCTISGNSVYLTSTVTPTSNSITWHGIMVKGNNHVVTYNYIGGTTASSGGTALTIAGTKENKFYGISVVGTLASSNTSVEYNTINNISFSTQHRSSDNITTRTAGGGDQSFTGITITEGAAKVHSNIIGGPTAGSITVINTNTANPATVNDGSNWGYSTELVGIMYNTKTGTINNTSNTIQGLWCYPSSSATTNLNARVIGIYAYTDASSNPGYTHKIQNNTIGGTGGLKAGNNTASDAFVYGILTTEGRGTIQVKNNTISNLWVNATGDYGYLRGIHNNGGIRAEIQNNTISNLVCAANNTFGATGDHRNRAIVGLMCDNDGGDCDYFFLIKNTVYDLRSTATTAKINMIGIYYRHYVAPVYGRVYGNKVYSINAVSTDFASKIIGIWAYGQNTITYNNMVSLGNNVSVAAGASCPNTPLNSGNYELIGIENNYGKNEYYYNTINIVGTSTGGSNTYAYKYVNPGTESLTRIFRNNIFSNTRSSTAGTQKNYAFSVSLQEAYGKFTSDYNYFYVSGTNGVLFDDFGTDRTTIAAWTASSGKDANSTGTGVLTPANPLFVAPCNCECNLDITDLNSPIIGTGSTTGIPTFILDDFNSNNRNAINNAGAVIVGATTLPIELLNFTGEKIEKSTKLEWITTSEVNNDYFTIERSIDGFHFEPIVNVKGAGNSNNLINYEVTDENPMKGINYYRLKQTDYDGVFSYSHVIAINFSDNPYMVHVYPNPFNQIINVNISGIDDKEALISIYDIAGKQVYSQSTNNNGNLIQIELDSIIPNGVYFMTIEVASSIKHIKIIKTNN